MRERERLIVLPCRHRRWLMLAASGVVGALAAFAVHVEREAALDRRAALLLHGGILRVPVHPASEADLLATRIETQLGLLKALKETRDVDRLVAEWIALRELMVRAGELPELKRRVPGWNLLLEDTCGERRGPYLWLQELINNGNQGLRQLADAIGRRDLVGAEAAHAWIEETVAEMRREEREVFQRNADALEQRGRKLLDEARRVRVESSRIQQLEAENARLERLAAGRKGLAGLIRWVRPEGLGQGERGDLVLELYDLVPTLDDLSIRHELVRLVRELDELGYAGQRRLLSLWLWINEGNRALRVLADAVKAGDRRAAEAAFAQAEDVDRAMRGEEREVFHHNADALIARAREVLARLPERREEGSQASPYGGR